MKKFTLEIWSIVITWIGGGSAMITMHPYIEVAISAAIVGVIGLFFGLIAHIFKELINKKWFNGNT